MKSNNYVSLYITSYRCLYDTFIEKFRRNKPQFRILIIRTLELRKIFYGYNDLTQSGIQMVILHNGAYFSLTKRDKCRCDISHFPYPRVEHSCVCEC